MDRFWTFVLRRNSSHPCAVYLALGGTAAAAATLARDSVGSPQIRADAVRPPEIESGAVRSSEIRDEDIKVADVATAARFALLPDVRVAELEDGLAVPACDDLSVCTNILTLNLSSGPLSRTAEPSRQSRPGTGLSRPRRMS